MPEVDILIDGSEGAIEVNDDQVVLNSIGREGTVWHRHDLDDRAKFWLGAPEYYREDEYFINMVKAKSEAQPSFETASRVDLLIHSMKKRVNSIA